jgi:Dolichyl-phosphate-mannose-protein mannosyltransferase
MHPAIGQIRAGVRTHFSSPANVGLWIVILAVAAGLRLWGITWGFPRPDLNPDESLVLRTAMKMTWSDPNPHFYNYCGFIFHVSFLSSEILEFVGVDLGEIGRLLLHRLWTVIWGTLTVPVVFVLAREVGGSVRGAFLAAALFAITPLHVWESHFGTTDAPLLLFMTASLVVSVGAAERPTWQRALLAGLLTGFATGTKYPGAFGTVPFVAAMAIARFDRTLPTWQGALRLMATFGAAAIAGSFMVSPYQYLDGVQTMKTFLFELDNVETGHFGFDLNVPGWQYRPYVYEFAAAFPFGLGLALALLAYVSIGWFAWRPNKRRLVALAFVAIFFGITGSWLFVPVRYFMPLFPVLIVAAGLFLDALLQKRRGLGVAVALVVMGYTAAFTATTTHRFTYDTRNESGTWIEENVPPGSVLLLAHSILRSYSPFPDPDRVPSRQVRLGRLDRTAAEYQKDLADSPTGANVYVSASGLEYLRYYRTKEPESVAAWDHLRANPAQYRLVRVFERWYLNKDLYSWLDPMYANYFVAPRIEIYEAIAVK